MTVAISENRKQSITDTLVQHGVEPTESALAAVVEMMTKEKLGVKEACAKLAQSYGQAHQQKAQGGINQAIEGQLGMAQKMGHLMGQKMMKVSAQVATNHFMNSLVDGSYLAEMDSQFAELENALNAAWDVQFSSISGSQNAPLLLESSEQEIR